MKEGNSSLLCLEYFVVALNRAVGGRKSIGNKRWWYVSTLDLQLASLELCQACRRVRTLHVKIGIGTPRSIWRPENPLANTSGGRRHPQSSVLLKNVLAGRAVRLVVACR